MVGGCMECPDVLGVPLLFMVHMLPGTHAHVRSSMGGWGGGVSCMGCASVPAVGGCPLLVDLLVLVGARGHPGLPRWP